MDDPNQADTLVQVAQQTKPGQALAFTISGTGTISDQPAQATGGGPQSGPMNENPQTESNRPGGGLGAPIDAPDPLEKYRWPIHRSLRRPARRRRLDRNQTPDRHSRHLWRYGRIRASGARATFASGPLAAPITGPGAKAMPGAGSPATSPDWNASGPNAVAAGAAPGSASTKSSMILDALKEELFQLEIERKQGKISPDDYEKAKAALDQTLERALRRQS